MTLGMTLGQGHISCTFLGQGQQFCEILSRSDQGVRSYGQEMMWTYRQTEADRQTDSIPPNKVKTLVTSELTDEEASVSVVYCQQNPGVYLVLLYRSFKSSNIYTNHALRHTYYSLHKYKGIEICWLFIDLSYVPFNLSIIRGIFNFMFQKFKIW